MLLREGGGLNRGKARRSKPQWCPLSEAKGRIVPLPERVHHNSSNSAVNYSVALDVPGLVPEDLYMSYRVYIDESGDHTFNAVEHPTRRYLGLTAVVFRKADYDQRFLVTWRTSKSRHFPYDVDRFFTHRSAIKDKEGPISGYSVIQESGGDGRLTC